MAQALAKTELTAEQEKACELAANGQTFENIAKAIGISPSTLSRRLKQLPAFADEFTSACDAAVETDVDKLRLVLDAELFPDLNRARIWSDNVKWIAARRSRRKYGDKLDVDVNVNVDIGQALAEARARILPPMRHPEQIDDADFTVESKACEQGPGDKQSPAALPGPQPDIFS